MTELDSAQAKAAVDELDPAQAKETVDAILARTALPVIPEDYVRLLALYPALLKQAADLRLPELRDLEPAVIYHASPAG
jgi:hypothetical protein